MSVKLTLIGISFCLLSTSPICHAQKAIIFVGDGMGPTTIAATRIFEAQKNDLDWRSHMLSFEEFPNVALVRTHTVDAQIPDSAGTMSAIMTGHKTRSGVISVKPKYAKGDCKSVFEDPPRTLFEHASEAGFSTGVISNSRVTDATPAATYGHSPDRMWENDSKTPDFALKQGCGDLASQMIDFGEGQQQGQGLDLVLGGGRESFRPTSAVDPEYPESSGARKDGKDLIANWLRKEDGREFVWNLDQFRNLDPLGSGRILGLFEPREMLFNLERVRGKGDEPSLVEMTEFAIRFLENKAGKDGGYLLMIEGARIDHGNHAKIPILALTETIEFSKAVKKALSLVDLKDTLVLVTADHSSSIAFTGYPEADMPILASLSYPSFSLIADDGRDHVMAESEEEPLEFDPSSIPSPHAGEDVAVYAIGLGASKVHGTLEQHSLFDIIFEIIL